MALIVEDGTGLATAESYCDVAFANDYHSKRANDAWDLLEVAEKEAHLRRATDYMMQVYRGRWKGYRNHKDQALDWPRDGVYRDEGSISDAGYLLSGLITAAFLHDKSVVPIEVKRACAELALRSTTETLAPDIDRVTSSESVGGVAVTYAGGVPYKRFRAIDLMLVPYLIQHGAMGRVVR